MPPLCGVYGVGKEPFMIGFQFFLTVRPQSSWGDSKTGVIFVGMYFSYYVPLGLKGIGCGWLSLNIVTSFGNGTAMMYPFGDRGFLIWCPWWFCHMI